MRFSSWMRSVKARITYSALLGNGLSCNGSNLRQSRSLRKHRKCVYTILEIERLEDRITPSAPPGTPEAIFYYNPSTKSFVSIPNNDPENDIITAFSDILIGTGRSHVLQYQVRRGGGEDLTAHGAYIDAWFTTAGLYTYDPINNVYLSDVTVNDFAHYFRFDHFNWEQTLTIPSTWSAKDDDTGLPLLKTFTDPWNGSITLTGYLNNTENIPSRGDETGLYLPGDLWKKLYVNPMPLDTNPTPGILGLPNNKYYFAFEDRPLLSTTMYGSTGVLQFTTTLVGVKYDGSSVSLASSSGTSFTWQSNNGTITGKSIDTGGANFVGYLQPFDSPSDLIVNSGGISNVQFVSGDSPAVTTNPTNQIAGTGGSVSFVAAAIGSPDPTVQWQVSTDGGNTFSDIAGATSTTLTFTASPAENGNQYRAVFTNSAGSVMTTAATLTIATSPIITTNPTSQVASAGNAVSFVAAAVGTPAPTVQWQVSTDGGNTFSNIAGATTTTLAFTTDASQNENEYRAVFTNASGTATTTPAILTVNTIQGSLMVDATNGVFPQFNLNAPSNQGPQYFGSSIVQLTNGNIVVTAVGTDKNNSAAYLFNGQTGVLISALTELGDEAPTVTALPNGNFVVDSPDWDFGLGAVTWVNGTTGLNGTPSAANSLIGSTVFDHVGGLPGAGGGVTALANGNYVVASPSWGSNGSTNGLGAVTWGNGTMGTSGVVSAANSLVGSTVGDNVGSGDGSSSNGVTALTNGNYVVDSTHWGGDLGAVTWGNGTAGITGIVSAANSLVGSSAGGGGNGDNVGWGGVTALTNGNYVVDSERWNRLAGAVTWGNGIIGISGVVSATNSLVGSNAYPTEPDLVGSGGVMALTNGNYVVDSPSWAPNSSNDYVGAVTWADGTKGITGPVSTANSLVGENIGDTIGGGNADTGLFPGTGVTALTNGNYVVDSPAWGTQLSEEAGAGAIPLGAVTWEDGTKPATGTVNATNSLVGYTPGTILGNGGEVGIGGVTALANGNYVVDSPNWSNGSTSLNGLGAVTWGNGATGTTGMISASNSLVGSFIGDSIGVGSGGGYGGIFALTNGNYVVDSPNWYANTGAVTLGNGATGSSGSISAANSLVGNKPGDEAGGALPLGSITALANGNYVVLTANTGTATFGNGTTGVQGTLSSVQSLNGVTGLVYQVIPLPNGNYIMFVNNGGGSASDTWVNGITGNTLDGKQTIDAQNSLMGVGGAVPIFGGSAFLATNAFNSQVTTGFTDPNLLTFALAQGQTITVTPDFLTSTLNTGVNVTVQANDDITINSPITENPTSTPGDLTLQAGRSILLNSNINTAGGNLTLIGNDSLVDGVVNSERDPGNAVIAEQSGAAINTGTGTLTIDLKNGTDKTNNGVGTVTLPNVTASSETLSSTSTVGITINGTTPGDGATAGTYTQLNVSGAIDLNGASLAITHSAATAKGTTFIIVQSTAGVTGTFNGLNEDATVTASDGTQFSISYQANGGNEVVLTQLTQSPQPPAFTSADSATFTVGSPNSFTVTASGFPVPTLSESKSDTLPSGVTFNSATGVLSGTPAAGSGGTYNMNFTATNSAGSVNQTFTLTINQTSVITSSNSVTFATGQFSSFTVTATGSPMPALTESGALPGGVGFTDNGNGSASLAGAPDAGSNGTYKFTINAQNGVGSDFTQNFTLTVNQQQAPTITSGNSATFIVGQSGTFTVTATGAPTPTLTESGTLPNGVTFTDHDNGTATLGGTAAAGTKGTYQFSITASNGVGSDFTQSFTLTVNLSSPPPPPPPPLTPPPPHSAPPVLHVPPLVAFFDSLLGAMETINANDTETVTDSFLSIPLIVATYDSGGNFVGATLLGIDVPNWIWEL